MVSVAASPAEDSRVVECPVAASLAEDSREAVSPAASDQNRLEISPALCRGFFMGISQLRAAQDGFGEIEHSGLETVHDPQVNHMQGGIGEDLLLESVLLLL